jgi:hypothetical protein
MRKLSITLAAAALVLTSFAFAASAQTQAPGASSLDSLARNATPIHQAACTHWARCPAGWTRVCNGWGRCWCRPC